MQATKTHTALDQHVIRTLLYYDIFSYPLTSREVFRFLGMNSVTESDVAESLDSLAEEGLVSRSGEYYGMQPDPSVLARRLRGNSQARSFHSIALKKARFISKFPFVRAVMGSGSLSKDYMDESCDLDFFIVTAPGRLWIARTLLVLYKRLFLNNSHKFFCVNYFVDEEHLEIEEKNLFTATELATVLPLYGAHQFRKFHDANRAWVKRFLPNYEPRASAGVPLSRNGALKRACEAVIDLCFGDYAEKTLMKLTWRRWRMLYQKNYDSEDFSVAFKTKKYVSKNHPRNYQKKIIEIYRDKLAWFDGKGFEAVHD